MHPVDVPVAFRFCPEHCCGSNAALGQGTRGQGPNLLFYFADEVGGRWVGYLMIIAVLASTVADT